MSDRIAPSGVEELVPDEELRGLTLSVGSAEH